MSKQGRDHKRCRNHLSKHAARNLVATEATRSRLNWRKQGKFMSRHQLEVAIENNELGFLLGFHLELFEDSTQFLLTL